MALLLSTDAAIQQRAYAVLGEILAMPLAASDWTIHRNGGIEIVVEGRLPDHNGVDWTGEILRYAAALELRTRRTAMPGHPRSTRFEACGKWHDVRISVWTPQTAEDRKAWGR